MSIQYVKLYVIAAAAGAGALFGVGATVVAADMNLSRITAYPGESPEVRARAKTFGITKYEDDDKVGGAGAEQRVLIDNEVVRVNLVSFKKGFTRSGGLLRKNDQMVVFVDQGDYTMTRRGDTNQASSLKGRPAPGSTNFHYADTILSELHIDGDYRALFIELKKK